MKNYLNNNLILINEYQKMYKNKIDIEDLINKLNEKKIAFYNGFDYGRFRVYVDSCLLLLNKEKLNFYYKNSYSYKGFFDEVKKHDELNNYFKFIKDERITSSIEGIHLYYSLEGQNKSPWNQVATIRNAMAHMQYGHFMSQEKSGLMLYYFLYNKHKGVRKDYGIVYEPILHEFIHAFFSNYSYGILFKNTFFSNYSFEKRTKTRNIIYYEITYKNKDMEKYNGYNGSLMGQLASILRSSKNVFTFLEEHKEELNINEISIRKIPHIRSYRKLAKKMKLIDKNEYAYMLKTFFDFETELSNFLIHISKLNDVLYQYSMIRDLFDESKLEMYNKEFEKAILELKEDENARFAFDIGFTYLKVMNFVLRIEDDDYVEFKYDTVDVSKFIYEKGCLDKYSKKIIY
ncbi:MAG: hypothetical protein E6929_14920 [Clostridium sp.]|nr:hypothetical protein [Clostridium sp.]